MPPELSCCIRSDAVGSDRDQADGAELTELGLDQVHVALKLLWLGDCNGIAYNRQWHGPDRNRGGWTNRRQILMIGCHLQQLWIANDTLEGDDPGAALIVVSTGGGRTRNTDAVERRDLLQFCGNGGGRICTGQTNAIRRNLRRNVALIRQGKVGKVRHGIISTLSSGVLGARCNDLLGRGGTQTRRPTRWKSVDIIRLLSSKAQAEGRCWIHRCSTGCDLNGLDLHPCALAYFCHRDCGCGGRSASIQIRLHRQRRYVSAMDPCPLLQKANSPGTATRNVHVGSFHIHLLNRRQGLESRLDG